VEGARGLHAQACGRHLTSGTGLGLAIGAGFGDPGVGVGLFAVELIIGGVALIGAVRRTRLPLPSRVLEIVCAMAAALEQNTTPAINTAFVIVLIALSKNIFAIFP
jgi:hypothetical protein